MPWSTWSYFISNNLQIEKKYYICAANIIESYRYSNYAFDHYKKIEKSSCWVNWADGYNQSRIHNWLLSLEFFFIHFYINEVERWFAGNQPLRWVFGTGIQECAFAHRRMIETASGNLSGQRTVEERVGAEHAKLYRGQTPEYPPLHRWESCFVIITPFSHQQWKDCELLYFAVKVEILSDVTVCVRSPWSLGE